MRIAGSLMSPPSLTEYKLLLLDCKVLDGTIMAQANRFGDSKMDIKISEIVVTTFTFGWTDTNPRLSFLGLVGSCRSEKN